jgi:Mg-chelatase subunit ChlD
LPVGGAGTDVKPPASFSLQLEADKIDAGAPIAALFDGFPGNREDWLSIAAAGSRDDQYLQAISLQGAKNGRVVFKSLGAGSYELRAYFNWPDNGYKVEGRVAFDVAERAPTPPGSLVRTARTDLRTGEPITVVWQNFPGFDGDYIYIVRRGEPDNASGIDYHQLKGRRAGRVLFTQRYEPGDYEVRAYFNNEYTVQDRFPFTILPADLLGSARDDTALPGLTNVALRALGAFVQSSTPDRAFLNDGDAIDYGTRTGFAVIDRAAANRIWLAKPYPIDRVRLLLWDREERQYRFRLEATADGVNWKTVSDNSAAPVGGGWHEVGLVGEPLVGFRLAGAEVDGEDTAFRVVEFAAYTRETVPATDLRSLPADALPAWSDRPAPQPLDVAHPALAATVEAPSGQRFVIDGMHDEQAAATAAPGEFITLRLGQPYAIERLRVDLGARRGVAFKYRVEGSSDGTIWRTIADRSDAFHSGVDEFPLGEPSLAALRIVPVELKGADSLTVVELEAFAGGAMPVTAIAEALPDRLMMAGRNLALAVNGGAAAASSAEDRAHGAAHLIDGEVDDWRTADTNFPEEIVIRLGGTKDALIDAIDFYGSSYGAPRIVDVAVASAGASSGWSFLGRFALDDRLAQRIAFDAVTAHAVRLRIVAGYSQHRVGFGEIVVREAVRNGYESVLPSRWPGFKGGLNIASAALGGQILAAEPYDADPNYGPLKLNDGFHDSTGAWASDSDPTTPYVTFGFIGGQSAAIAGLSFNPDGGHSNFTGDQRWTSMVDVWTSSESKDSGFRWVGRYRLDQAGEAQTISFKPVEARFVRVLLLDTFGSPGAVMGEIEVLELPGGASVTTSQPPNLLDLRYGGHVAVPAGADRSYLIDSTSATDGWYDDSGTRPIDLTFGFRQSQPRSFDAIGFNPRTKLDPATWARRAKVLVSDHPLRGFRLIGEYDIQPEDRLQYFSFPVETARYVRVTLLDNGGDQVMSLGDVAIREVVEEGGLSVLARLESEAEEAGAVEEEAVAPLTGDSAELEPNDSRDTANALAFGKSMTGAVDPLTDKDFFHFDTSSAATNAVNARIEEQPSLRSELTIYGTSGAVVASQPLYDLNQPSADFTWLLKQGPHDMRLAKAQNSIVFIVDRSGSVTSVRPQIASAAVAFAENANPDEAISFAAMDGGYVYNDFTNDKDTLVATALLTAQGSGGSGVYESLMGAMARLEGRKGAKAIVIVTDGEDSGSSMQPLFDLWTKLGTTGVRIYTVGFGAAATNPLGGLLGSTGGDMLRNFSAATGGRFFLAPDGDAMATIYRKVAADLRASSGYRLTLTPATANGRLEVLASGEHISGVSAPRKVEVILDASGSMKKKLEGNRTRMQVAREVLHGVVDQLPDGTEVALRVFGHRLPSKPHDLSCTDIELVVPFAALDRDRLHDVVDAINPRGETPIGRSLALMSADFGEEPGRKFAILVTDGEESCDPDPNDQFYPIKVVDLIKGAGIDLTVNIVGFAIGERATRDFLAQLAETTGGKYYDAGSSEALSDALDAAFAADFVVQDSLGNEAGRGKVGGVPIELPEGHWRVTLDSEPKIDLGTAVVGPDRLTTINLRKEGDRVEIATAVE